MKTPNYQQIATSFKLWQEYADPSGLDSEAAFNEKSVDEKINFLVSCFGAETANTEAQ